MRPRSARSWRASERQDVDVADAHGAAADAAAAARVAHQRERDRRLAGARFADQRQHLAGADREAHVAIDVSVCVVAGA